MVKCLIENDKVLVILHIQEKKFIYPTKPFSSINQDLWLSQTKFG